MDNAFQPTHEITITDARGMATRTRVQLVDGVAYTKEEWDAEASADWEVVDGEWRFQGRAHPSVGAVAVRVL